MVTFGIKHNGKKATQSKPYLKVENQIVPAVELNESFKLVSIGKKFNYRMETDEIEKRARAETN